MTRRPSHAAALLAALSTVVGCSSPTPDPEAASGATRSEVWFEEVAAERGLAFTHASGHSTRFLLPEIMGGGVALVDVDHDGDLDIYAVQGGRLGDERGSRRENRLYLNDGRGSFNDATAASGAGDRGYGMGVAAGDADGDGDTDLYVTNVGRNTLLQNEGGGRFTDVTERAGVGDPGWSTAAAFVDIDADGDLDLFVVNYVHWSAGVERDCTDANRQPDYCTPMAYGSPAMDRLYRNRGDGTFEDVSREVGLDRVFGNGLGLIAEDFDGDGRTDLFVANDGMTNQLWMNRGATLEDEAMLRGCALDEQGLAKAGMGVASEDLENDGDPDLLVVNLQGETDSYFRNEGDLFVDDTAAVGLAAGSRWFTRFGVGFADFDNDGRLDLYEANGRISRSAEPLIDDAYAEPNLLYRGTATGTFEEVDPRGGTDPALVATSRAAAFGDLDDDGGVDIVVINRDGPLHLLRNVVPDRGNALTLRVLESNGAVALGARVTIEIDGQRRTRTVRASSSYLASNDPRVHFGLAGRTSVDRVEVRWTDGTVETFDIEGTTEVVTLRRRMPR